MLGSVNSNIRIDPYVDYLQRDRTRV